MPTAPPCPACDSATTLELYAINRASYVNYYRCDQCGHVWVTTKDNPNKIARHITPEPRKPASGE